MAHDKRLQRSALIACFCITFVQTTSVQAPTFEAASVKRSVPGTPGGRVQFLPGRFVGENVSLDYLLQQVHGVRGFQIIAAPAWKAIIADGRDSRYQIQATTYDTATPEQVRRWSRPSIFTALQEQMGLRLEAQRAPSRYWSSIRSVCRPRIEKSCAAESPAIACAHRR